jgi:hypothetical protein
MTEHETERTPEMTPAVETTAELRADLRQIMIDTEAAIAAAAAGRFAEWAEGVQAALARLHEAFHEHVKADECTGGLYDEVLDREPRLRAQVTRLKKEHRSILAAIHAPFKRLRNRGEEFVPADEIRREVTAALGRITLHRQRGADLVYETYMVDLGGLD